MPPLQGGRLVLVLVSLFFLAEMERGAGTVSCLGPTDEDSSPPLQCQPSKAVGCESLAFYLTRRVKNNVDGKNGVVVF
jgi:hypothetical protein